MAKVRYSVEVLVCACLVAFTWTAVRDGSAATKKPKEPVPIAVTKPVKQQPEQGLNPSIQRTKRSPLPSAKEPQPEAIQKQAKPELTELKQTSPKSARQMKVHRKSTPKAVVQPRTDLMYHGMLETPRRYDPRRNYLGVGVLDPHNPELTHDHFQELDRNQDGKIDPVERAFGRLDMHWDISTHQRR